MHRFFSPTTDFTQATLELTEPEILHQLSKVLRAKVDQQIILLDGSGMEFVVELAEINKSKICARVLERRKNIAEPEVQITLYQALPKNPARFEAVIQHGTEIGIVKFVPILTERTEVRGVKNRTRLEKIICESTEQCGRGLLPTLTEPMKFEAILKNLPTGKNLVGDSFSAPPLLSALLPSLKKEKTVNIFIGPEGGFSASEIKAAQAVGVQSFSLGKRILRTETAGIAVASALFFS